MSYEKVKIRAFMDIHVYIVTCVCFCVAFNVTVFETKAQSTDRNNIKSLEIHRLDYYNPGSSGDINPEISNRGIILLKHFKPTESWSTYEFNLSKYISIDTLDRLIEKVGYYIYDHESNIRTYISLDGKNSEKNNIESNSYEDVCVHRITRDTIYCQDYASVYPWLLARIDTNQYLDCITKSIVIGRNNDVLINIESLEAKGFASENYGYVYTNKKVYDWNNNPPYDYLLIGSNNENGEINRLMINEPSMESKGSAKSMDDNLQIIYNRIIHKEVDDRGNGNFIQRSGYMIIEDTNERYLYVNDDFLFELETVFSGLYSDRYEALENVFIIKRRLSGGDSVVYLFSSENPKGIEIDCSQNATFMNYQMHDLNGSWYVPILCEDNNKFLLIDYKNHTTFQVPAGLKIVKEYGYIPDKSQIYSTKLKKELKKHDVQRKLEDKVIFMDVKKKLYVYENEKLVELNKSYTDKLSKEAY